MAFVIMPVGVAPDRLPRIDPEIRFSTDGAKSMPRWRERVAAFEAKYGMTTAQMLEAFRAGAIEDTADIAEWQVLSKAMPTQVPV